jgi:hypothetical protein
MHQVAFLLLNFSVGVIAEGEPSKESRLGTPDALRLLGYFMPVAGSDLRILVLETLGDKLEINSGNLHICLQSSEFNQVLLSALKDPKPRELQAARRIMMICLEYLLSNQIRISEYVILLKALASAQLHLEELLCGLYLEFCRKKDTLTISQLLMFLLLATAEYRRTEGEPSPDYWALMQYIAPRTVTLLHQRYQSSPSFGATLLIEQLGNLPHDTLNISLFNLEMNVIAEEDITFLFDICLPKAAAGCNVESLFQDTKRRVYGFEILMWALLGVMKLDEESSREVVAQLLNILKVFFSVSLLKSELRIDKSFVRMVLFSASQMLCSSPHEAAFVELWVWVMELVKEQGLRFKAGSYADLIGRLSLHKLQPFLVEIFEIFLRPNSEEYLLPF